MVNSFLATIGKAIRSVNPDEVRGMADRVVHIGLMASNSAGLVWSPRSNISLYGFTADVGVYHTLGVRIALTENQRLFRSLGYREISREAHPGFTHPTSINMRKVLL